MPGISNTNSYDPHVTDGVTRDFGFTFFAYLIAHIKVYLVDQLTGAKTDVTSQVTITLNTSFIGGNVNFGAGLWPTAPDDADLLIRRETPYTQDVLFSDLIRLKEPEYEKALNLLEMQIQQVKSLADLSLKFGETSGVTNVTIGNPVDQATLIFDGVTGSLIAGPTVGEIQNAAAAATTATTQAGIATAQAGISTTQAGLAAGYAQSALNALAAAGLPSSLTGKALNYLRVKADETGYEFRTAANIIADLQLVTSTSLTATLANYATTSQLAAAIAGIRSSKIQDLIRGGTYGRQPCNAFFVAAIEGGIGFGTFARASAASRTKRNPVLASVTSGTQRIDYERSTGKLRGVLFEQARTNAVNYSEDLSNAYWAKLNTTIPATNVGVGPDGTATLDRVAETASNAQHYAWSKTGTYTMTSGDSVIVSQFVRAETIKQFCLLLDTGVPFAAASFTALDTATPVANKNYATSGGNVSCVDAYIEDWSAVSPGLFRCVACFRTTGATSYNVYARLLDASLNLSYLGSTGNTIQMGCIQIELGSNGTSGHQKATTYIPATGAATATRAADTFSIALSGLDFRTTEGTMFFVGSVDTMTELFTGNALISLDDGTANNAIAMTVDYQGNVSGGVTVGGVAQAQIGAGAAVAPYQEFACAIRWKANDFQVCVNGTLGAPDTSGTVPTVTQLQLSRYGGIWNLNGCVRMFGVINAALSDADLQAITSTTAGLQVA